MWRKTSVFHFTKKKQKKKNMFLVFWRVTRICWSPIKTPKIWDTWPLTWNNLETKPALENHLWTYPKFQSKGCNILKNCDIQDIWKVKPWNLLCFLLLASLGDFVKCSQTVYEKTWENRGIQPGSQCLDGLSGMANHRTMSGVFRQLQQLERDTHRKLNIALKNRQSQKGTSLPLINFHALC